MSADQEKRIEEIRKELLEKAAGKGNCLFYDEICDDYEEKLEFNINQLYSNIRNNTYEPKNIRGCYIEADTKVGDTKVNNLDRKSDVILSITSRVGDIKVNY